MNYIFTYISFFTQIVTVAILSPIIERDLTPDITVKFLLLYSVLSFLGLFSFGLPSGFLRALINSNGVIQSNIIKTFIIIMVKILIYVAGGVFLMVFFGKFFLKGLNTSELLFLYVIFVGYITYDFISQISIARGAIWLPRALRALQYIIITAVILAKIQVIDEFVDILVVFAVASLLPTLGLVCLERKYLYRAVLLGTKDTIGISSHLRDSTWYFSGAIIWLFLSSIDSFLVYKYFPVEQSIAYLSMLRLLDAGKATILQTSAIFFPKIASMQKENDKARLSQYLIFLVKVFSFLAFAAIAFNYLFGFTIYKHWMSNVHYHSFSLFLMLSLYQSLIIFDSPFSTYAGALGIHKKIVILAALQLILKLLFIFFSIYNDSIILLAASGVFAMFLTNLWYNPYLVIRSVMCK